MSKHQLSTDDLAELAREFAADETRSEVIELYCEIYGVRPETVYRWAQEGGFSNERKQRKDKGERRSPVDPAEIQRAAMVKFLSTTKKYDSPMPAEVAADMTGAAASGVRPHHVNELTRKMHLDKAASQKPTPHILRSTTHPNEEHQFDTSRCAMWYLDDRQRFCVNRLVGMDKNKQPKGKPIIRYVLVDHFTHLFFFQYQTEFESFRTSTKFLYQAWIPKPDRELFPFCGVPDRLYIDQGPTFHHSYFKRLCENLSIKLEPKQPTGTRSKSGKLGGARALGAVEVAHWIIETAFESRLRLKKPESLDVLNEWAYKWCIWWNGTKKHSRYGMSRSQLWSTIQRNQLRIPPSNFKVFMSFSARRIECKIYSDFTVRFNGRRYLVKDIPVDLCDSKAQVMYSPFNFPEIQIKGADGCLYSAHPLTRNDPLRGGFYSHAIPSGTYRAYKDTTAEKSQKEAEKFDFGEVDPFPDFTRRLANLRYLPKPGYEIEGASWPVVVPIMDAIAEIQEALCRPITTAENRTLRERYGEALRSDQIYEAIYEFYHSAEEREDRA